MWPLAPRPAVARPFAAPRSRYGAGHRGVDLASQLGQQVLAVDSGTVSHVGVIAGRGTVSVLHPSGLRSTYEPVVATVHRGDVVARGDPLGTVSDVAGHCAPQTCLHLGAVRGGTYVDPLQLLTTRRVRLLPLE
jgi:murein DD-endopeptidase MepM/ murein hydrolase activator NlpD